MFSLPGRGSHYYRVPAAGDPPARCHNLITPLQSFHPRGTHCKTRPCLHVRRKPPETSANHLLTLCSPPSPAYFEALLQVRPHGYDLSQEFVDKYPTCPCPRVLVPGGHSSFRCRRLQRDLPYHGFHPSHPPGAACAPELLWILTGCDAAEKLCLSLSRVQSLQKAFYFSC